MALLNNALSSASGREPLLTTAIAHVDAGINELHDKLEQLVHKLSGVMMAETPQEAKPAVSGGANQPQYVLMIQAQEARIRVLIGIVENTISRLEV